MFPLVEMPLLVQHDAPFFKEVFSVEALVEFERYTSGLLVSENKTVEGINCLFVIESRNQSSLNRLLTQSPFSLAALNRARLAVLGHLPGTQRKASGVLSLDDTLLVHYGQHFEEIAQLYDHVSGSYVWAHDLVTLHYSDDQTDYPLLFELWKPVDLAKLEAGLRAANIPLKAVKETWKDSAPRKWRSYLLGVWHRRQKTHPELRDLYESKLRIAQDLLSTWMQAHPEETRPVTFDAWFTHPDFCQFVDQTLHLPYVGTLAASDSVQLARGDMTLGDFADRLKAEHLENQQTNGQPVFRRITIPFKGAREPYYSYCQTHRFPHFGKQRLVINYRQADLSDNPTFYISNRLVWQATGITRIRRHRWPVEVYHEEGKAEGLDQYQLRDFRGIQRHVALVAVVSSLLRAAPHDPDLRICLQQELQLTLEAHPAAWRRASQAHALWSLSLLISTGLAQGQPLAQIMAPLMRAMC